MVCVTNLKSLPSGFVTLHNCICNSGYSGGVVWKDDLRAGPGVMSVDMSDPAPSRMTVSPEVFADLQLSILWEEILKRGLNIEVLGPPERIKSNFMRVIKKLPVSIAA